jgi:hypothetical protein
MIPRPVRDCRTDPLAKLRLKTADIKRSR